MNKNLFCLALPIKLRQRHYHYHWNNWALLQKTFDQDLKVFLDTSNGEHRVIHSWYMSDSLARAPSRVVSVAGFMQCPDL